MTLYVTVPVLVQQSLSALMMSDEEKKEDEVQAPFYELHSGHGRSRARGPGASVHILGHAWGSGAICYDAVDDISVIEEECQNVRGV